MNLNSTESQITLMEMEIFSYVTRYGSIHGISRAIGLTPAHVSKILARFEKKLGEELIMRSPKGISLTARGHALSLKYEKLIPQLEDLVSISAKKKTTKRQVVSVGGLSYLNRWLFSPHLKELSAQSEMINFRILDFTPGELPNKAVEGAFEMALHTSSRGWKNNWSTIKLGVMEWVLVARKGHPLSQKATLKEMQKYPFVVPVYWDGHGLVSGNDFCPVSWRERLKGHETSTADTAALIIQHTNQLAFLPKVVLLATSNLESIKIKGMKPKSSPIYLSVHMDKVQQSLFDRVRDTLSLRIKKL